MRIEGKRVISFIVKKDKAYSIRLADSESKVGNEWKSTVLEIRGDNITAICKLFQNDNYAFVGFGNKYRDNIVVNYVIENKETLKTVSATYIADAIDKMLEQVLEGKDQELEKKYKYASLFNSFDLQRFLFPKDQMPTLDEFVACSDFTHADESHDADNIVNILYESEARIKARLKVEEIYGEDLFDAHEGIVGARLMKSLYMKKTGLKWNEIKNPGNKTKEIAFKDIIFDNIHFENQGSIRFLDKLRNIEMLPNESWWEAVAIDEYLFNMNMAGLRMNTMPVKVESDYEGDVFNIDVASFWPSILCNYAIKPQQVKDEFLDIYKDLWKRRLEAKKTDKDLSSTLKFMLNGIIGQFMIEDSWLYDPIASMTIRINGGLMMMMLAERLIKDFDIICLTIDGMFVKSKGKDLGKRLEQTVKDWSKETKLTADITKTQGVWLLSNNDYITAEGNGKGFFADKGNSGHSNVAKVVRKAVAREFVDNIPVVDTVHDDKDVKDFLIPVISKKEPLEWEGMVFKTARGYYSSGSKICKIEENAGFGEPKRTPVTNNGFTVVGDLPNEFPDDIDLQPYIIEANKQVYKIKYLQTTLFQ